MNIIIGLILLLISLITFVISLGGIIYQHIVEFPNWKTDLPGSLSSYRSFFKRADFGNFFKIFMPTSSICLVIAIPLLWNEPSTANIWILLAMSGLVLTAVFTNNYFVPKHKKLFSDEITQTNVSELTILATQWGKGNLIRIGIMFLTVISFLKALSIYLT